MYETVKTVKGIAITRMIGSRGVYYINLKEGKGWKEFLQFRSIKAATTFIEENYTAPTSSLSAEIVSALAR